MPVPPELLRKFMQLYVGGTHAHGVWDPETGDCRTERSSASVEDYAAHLDGVRGLGLVPISLDGTCRFGAIDIDDDAIDHAALFKRVSERKFPLTVCRSKSGGAHLYVFMREPIKASALIVALKKWAGALGYGKSEIFPKQAKVSTSNIGNWINLSYFSSDRTVRYAVGPNGAMTITEFVEGVAYWDGTTIGDTSVSTEAIKTDQMPPCLVKLTNEGLTEGQRDSGLFNFAVFFRKSTPNGWEDLVVRHNQAYISPPLPNKDVQKIIKSVGQRKYQYTCSQEPICSRCDRPACLRVPFGVGHEPWKGDTDYAELQLGNSRKILTDPPKYLVEVNGKEVSLETDQLLNFSAFRKRVFELTSQLLWPMKADRWDQMLIDLMSRTKEVEAPADASEAGMIFDKVLDFLAFFERSNDREDLLRGLPVLVDDNIAFRIADLQKYLKSQFVKTSNETIYQLLHQQDCRYGSLRIKGKVVTVWLFPKKLMNLMTEDFSPSKIPVEDNEL